MKKLPTLAITLWFGVAAASEYPRVDEDLKAYDQRVAQLTQEFAKRPPAPQDKEWVKAKLQYMVDIDQAMRGMSETTVRRKYTREELLEFNQRMNWTWVDGKNTADLKELLKIYPWFTISEFGREADQNAWLLVQHADHDALFQRHMLAILEPLAAKGESNPKNFAYLFDRVASNPHYPTGRKLQRYGTQGQCTGPGTWEPFPVEDPEKLDERRASVGLGPEAEYQKTFANICHESTEEMLRRATEAAKKK